MTVQIPLTQGLFTTVDDEDAYLADRPWFACRNSRPGAPHYAVRNKPGRGAGLIQMHRIIIGAKDGEPVDHINGDTLDNRRLNLRCIPEAGNHQNLGNDRKNNTSGHRGVSWHKPSGTWRAQVQLRGQTVYSERFSDLQDAAIAVRVARKRLLPYDVRGTIGVTLPIDEAALPQPAPNRHNAGKTHCIRGHEFTKANTYIRPGAGGRSCLTCDSAYQQKRRRTNAPIGAYVGHREAS